MSKKLHLVCNAHLDPVWQWEWEEGAAEALSTFRIAADFCEKYDNFVFCHNEALLYKWIEEYDLSLFKKIQRLVKEKKWHIMGGWYLQPDCNMPGGEMFVRQIIEGRKYFLEKFNTVPTVAFNPDPFGHSRGLVQILKKSGYDGYLFMRPDSDWITLPDDEFKWIGYDGSEVTGVRLQGGYNSGKGKAAQKAVDILERCKEDDFYLCLWGVGNHGGGPSEKDLQNLETLSAEKAKEDIEIIHSTPEKYFAEVKQNHTLQNFDKSLNSWAVGCYTSQVRIKQKYRLAENTYFLAESMVSHAAQEGLMEYPEKEISQALYDILTIEFHDALPGSSIQPAEEMSLRTLDHALEILSKIKARAFFALTAGHKKASEDKIPIFAYNPYPYKIKGDFVCEFMLWDQIWEENRFLSPVVYAENGSICPSQCEKEYSSVPLEWRKRVVFNAELEPMQMNRFDCGFDEKTEKPKPICNGDENYYIFNGENNTVRINKKTGLVDEILKDGINFVKAGAFSLDVFKDNSDPWHMEETQWLQKEGSFSLLSKEEAQLFCCLNNPIEPVHVIESGDVRTVIEALFGYNSSRAVVKYILSESGEIKTEIRIVWNEKQKLIKMKVPAAFGADECIGEHPYGRETLFYSLKENVSQKYISLCSKDLALAVINNGTYGSSFDEKQGEAYVTLMRSPAYCAHPIGDRIVLPQDRYMPYIEQGERDFSFSICCGSRDNVMDSVPRISAQFNTPLMALSLYPSGEGKKAQPVVKIENNDIITLTAFKKAEDSNGYILRLFNPTENEQSARICYYGTYVDLNFGKFEIKTLRANKNSVEETDLMENLLEQKGGVYFA